MKAPLLWIGGPLVLCGAVLAMAGGGSACRTERDFDREIFMAVLEGCYADGVSTEAAAIMTRPDEASGWPEHFIQGCPVCMPAINALRAYALRPRFFQDKAERDTFGPGLAEDVLAALASPDRAVRLGAIEGLVQRWVEQRMDLLRLSPEERAVWAREMQVRRKKGLAMLETLREVEGATNYTDMSSCAFCDGANGACERR